MKYIIITYGCQMNKSDSERLAAKLEKEGHRPAKDIEAAGLVVINVCSVRQSAVNRVYSKVKQMRSLQPKAKIILTGCLLDKDKERFKNQIDGIWPFANLETKPKLQSKNYAFVPIMTGCNNFCSYCVVPYARGGEKSRKAYYIVRDVKELIQKGYKEIILLGQNVNSYSSKTNVSLRSRKSGRSNLAGAKRPAQGVINFPKLLRLLCQIPGDFIIKFITNHPKDVSDKLINIVAQNNKIAKEMHLPLQSGDTRILKKMNRGYTAANYKKLVKKIRRKAPGIKMSTDVIVGFPGETEKQFQNTVKLLKEIGFSQIYAAAYSPRPGTAAARLKDDIPPLEKKRRKRIILDMVK